MTNLSIKKYLKECRRLFPISTFNQKFYKNILVNLSKPLMVFDESIHVIGVSTPEYRNMIIPLDKKYIILDFSLMEILVDLSYIYKSNDWERYEYLYYTLSQEAELEQGNIDKLFFYSTLSQQLYDKEKDQEIEDSRNMLHIMLSMFFIAYHEFFHYQEKQYPHSKEYYLMLQEYIKLLNFKSKLAPVEIAEEVICDTEALVQLLHTGIGLAEGFVSREEILENSTNALVMLTVVQLLLKRLESVNEINYRIIATLGWLSTYVFQNKEYKGINYTSIIEMASDKMSIFANHTIDIAMLEKEKHILIPDLSVQDQMELLNVFLRKRNGVIISI